MTTPVVAIFHAKPGCEDVVDAMFRSVIEATLKEEGCIAYQLNRDMDDPARFVWTEEWESRASLDKHLASTHITDMFSKIPEFVDHSEVVVLSKLAGGLSGNISAENVCLTT
ncbi:putative quinol monooxygenase [uncultured Cohaesibacter sp.]|uniref:putative quinol monooxygenase n=1 Tax=uncultured Cohaesibacter sp. TaxID=1002546 RepID=UPI0029C74433|nr:putative quinol monooxygenase [uncultured Cohaesibacter sp.]